MLLSPHPHPDFPVEGHDHVAPFFLMRKMSLKRWAMCTPNIGSSHTYMYLNAPELGVVHIPFSWNTGQFLMEMFFSALNAVCMFACQPMVII